MKSKRKFIKEFTVPIIEIDRKWLRMIVLAFFIWHIICIAFFLFGIFVGLIRFFTEIIKSMTCFLIFLTEIRDGKDYTYKYPK